MTRPKIVIESWDPEYGSPLGDGAIEPSEATVETGVELPSDRWRPIAPPPGAAAAERVAFIDGVRRIEAMAWVEAEAGDSRRGICASFAAGVVSAAADRARVHSIQVRRGLFTNGASASLATAAGIFEPMAAAGDDLWTLSLALQQRLGELEVAVALGLLEKDWGTPSASPKHPHSLVVVDGPLSGRSRIPRAVGYVKTHRVSYLPPELCTVVTRTRAGERSPLFIASTAWTRYSWYLRLPGAVTHPWSCIVRLEASGDMAVADAVALADCSAATLPRYASCPHKDPRAPQNLFPIAGLERDLRHRLGDPGVVQRALRAAAAAAEAAA